MADEAQSLQFDLGMDLGDFDFLETSDTEFLTDEIDDATLSQVCEAMENEDRAFEGLSQLSLSQLLDDYDVKCEPMEVKTETTEPKDNRFGKPVTDDDLSDLIKNQENANTRNNTKWAANLFDKWRNQRSEEIPELHEMTKQQMSYWLERFIVEARKQDGSEYPPKSLYLILCGLLRMLKEKGVYDKNFLDEKNQDFAQFRKVVDARMKSLVNKGLGCEIKQADPILPDDEVKLWELGVFGRENGEQLQHTMFFYACKLFGLRGCDEHHDLMCEQFKIGMDNNGRFIHFIGRATKTYKGGLGQLNVHSKNLKHYSEPGK